MADDPASATSLVHGYLNSKGLPINSENVRRALEQNASNPGVIKGLTNQEPPKDDGGTSSDPASANGPRANAQTGDTNRGLPTPPVPPAARDAGEPAPGPTADNSSSMLPALAAIIAGGGGIAGLLHFLGNKGGPVPGAGGAAGGAVPPVAPTVQSTPMESAMTRAMGDGTLHGDVLPPQQIPGAGQPMRGGPTIDGQTVPSGALPAPQAALPAPANDPLQSALQKALGGPESMGMLPGPQGNALPAPPPAPAIRLQDGTSGPTINMLPENSKRLQMLRDMRGGGEAPQPTQQITQVPPPNANDPLQRALTRAMGDGSPLAAPSAPPFTAPESVASFVKRGAGTLRNIRP